MPRSKVELVEPAPQKEAPKPFVGHRHIVEYLRRLGPEGLAHAYLFVGPRGVGKRTLAQSLALSLHCERRPDIPLGFCGQCNACVRGIAGSSGDTIVVDVDFIRAADAQAGKSERKTDAMSMDAARAVIRGMQMRSYEGGRLVCIIPDFDEVTGDFVYNALLKELEEPDPGKLFILTAEAQEVVIPTIRSRTVMLRFGPLTEDDIARQLVRKCGETRERALAIARRSQGSLGEALRQRSTEGATLYEATRTWVHACLRAPREMPPMPALGDDDPHGALGEIIRIAKVSVRDVLAAASAGPDALLDAEGLAECRRTVKALGDDATRKTAAALGAIGEAARIAMTNVPPALVLGWLQMQLRSV